MEIFHRRKPTVKDTTFSDLFVPDQEEAFIHLLEDAIRELPGVPVEEWKIPGKTAISAGRYKVELVDSPKFGPDTLTLLDVPGYTVIRVHAGNDDEDTDGCPLTGMRIIPDPEGDGGNISDSKTALNKLKEYLVPKLKAGEEVYWNVVNP